MTLPDGSRRFVSGKTREACKDKLVVLQASIAEGLPTGDTDTLGPFLTWWLGRAEAKAGSGKKSTNTVDNARWAVEKWITAALGSKRLRDLSPEDVERLLDKMAAAGRSHRTIVRVKSYLGQALAVAQSRRKVSWNVARVAEMPETSQPVERRALTLDEAKKVLAAAEGHRLEALFVTGMMLGLRPGELTGLRWDERRPRQGDSARLQAPSRAGRGQLRLGETKTKRARAARIPAHVLTTLKAHEKRQKEERLKVGSAWRNKRAWSSRQKSGRRSTRRTSAAGSDEALCEDARGRASVTERAGPAHRCLAALRRRHGPRRDRRTARSTVRPGCSRRTTNTPSAPRSAGHVDHIDAIFG